MRVARDSVVCQWLQFRPPFCPTTSRHGSIRLTTRAGRTRLGRHVDRSAGRSDQTYTIFEGTSEIHRLIIARAISRVHIK